MELDNTRGTVEPFILAVLKSDMQHFSTLQASLKLFGEIQV